MHSLKVFYRPDNYPDWVFWKEFVGEGKFSSIGQPGLIGINGLPTAQAGFVPRQSLGKPPDVCDDKATSRRLRRGYEFQVKFVGRGHLVIQKFRIHAQRLVERTTANSP